MVITNGDDNSIKNRRLEIPGNLKLRINQENSRRKIGKNLTFIRVVMILP